MVMSPKLRFDVLRRDGFNCVYCGAGGRSVILEVDHRIAKSNGGSDDMENLVTSCLTCNRGKGASDCDEPRAHPMAGVAFHMMKNGEIDRQGIITGGHGDKIQVTYFDWFTGLPSMESVIAFDAVKDMRLYADCDAMNSAD